MAKEYIENVIKFRNVRIRSLNVHEKRKFKKDDANEVAKYRVTILLDPSIPEHKAHIEEMTAEFKRIAVEKKIDMETMKLVFGGGDSGKVVLCGGKGDGKKDEETGEIIDGFAGMFFVTLQSADPIVVCDRNLEPLTSESGRPYAGCIANVNGKFYGWNFENSKRGVSCELRSVQFVDDGPRFGRPPRNPEGEFEKLPPKAGSKASPAKATADSDGWDA